MKRGKEAMWDFWSSVRSSFQIESPHKKERRICDCIKVTWALYHTHLQLLVLIIFTIILTLVSVCYIFSSTKQLLIFLFFSNSKNNRRFDFSLFSQFRPRDGKTFVRIHTPLDRATCVWRNSDHHSFEFIPTRSLKWEDVMLKDFQVPNWGSSLV